MKERPDLFDQLVERHPFEMDCERQEKFIAAVNESYRHHYQSCAAYRRFCLRRGFDGSHEFTRLEDIPFLSVQAFKENPELLCSVPEAEIKVRLSSSATSGKPSTVVIDKKTSKRQIKALATVMSAVLGRKRRPFIVFDADHRKVGTAALGARNAAVIGFLNLAREARYVMDLSQKGQPVLNEGLFEKELKEFSRKDEPVCVFGFTYVLYNHGVKPLFDTGKRFPLPKQSKVIHIGGWKKLKDQQVSKDVFNVQLAEFFQINPSDIIDFYGFTEQMGVTYPDGPTGYKCVPAFSEVIVRDPVSLKPVPDGSEGLLEFITPLPYSYPGLAILTDDVGVVLSREQCSNGWNCTQFEILARAKKAETRGCGDIMGEKIVAPKRANRTNQPPKHQRSQAYLLFDYKKNYCPSNILDPVATDTLPKIENITKLADELEGRRKVLDRYTIDELICIIDKAAQKWMNPDSHLMPLRTQGLQFLSGWCRAQSLRSVADQSLRGARGLLDSPRSLLGMNRRLIFARPRGLVAHWLAGNVPLLGMLALVQCILTRNCNLLKASNTFSSVLPALLDTFRDLVVKDIGGRTLLGNDILKAITVVYYPREDIVSAEAMSQSSDVRIAWGGRSAVENIMNLPRRYGSEDIIFGPKLSYMAIGRDMLKTERLVRRYARRAATDASVFDQYACASPHTIFVESGGEAASPKDFAKLLAAEMDKALVRIPKAPVDSDTAAQIESIRLHYELTGDLWKSNNTDWSVLYDDKGDSGLVEPCYSRVITVRAIDDVMRSAEFAHPGIQTVGLALDGDRKLKFVERAALKGAERFPDIGRMTLFDTPWDGLFPMDRLVKWVSIGGPF